MRTGGPPGVVTTAAMRAQVLSSLIMLAACDRGTLGVWSVPGQGHADGAVGPAEQEDAAPVETSDAAVDRAADVARPDLVPDVVPELAPA